MKKTKHKQILATVISHMLEKGDTVECIDASPHANGDCDLVRGETYVVECTAPPYGVKLNGVWNYYGADRFRLVERKKPWSDKTFDVIKQALDAFFIVTDHGDNNSDIPWSTLPDSVQWVAKDKDGTKWGYRNEPQMGCFAWVGGNAVIGLHQLDIPGDWKESLRKRPGTECTCSIVEFSPGNPKFCQCERCENEEKKYNHDQQPESKEGESTEKKPCDKCISPAYCIGKDVCVANVIGMPMFQLDELILVRNGIDRPWHAYRYVATRDGKVIAKVGTFADRWKYAIKFDPEKAGRV